MRGVSLTLYRALLRSAREIERLAATAPELGALLRKELHDGHIEQPLPHLRTPAAADAATADAAATAAADRLLQKSGGRLHAALLSEAIRPSHPGVADDLGFASLGRSILADPADAATADAAAADAAAADSDSDHATDVGAVAESDMTRELAAELSPSEATRRAFRSQRPLSIDEGFSALRKAGSVLGWLRINHELRLLAAGSAPVEAGALILSDYLQPADRAFEAASTATATATAVTTSEGQQPARDLSAERLSTQLDELAAVALRGAPLAHSLPSNRLRALAMLNHGLFNTAGFRGQVSPLDECSAINTVMRRRRGLPILLCAVYQGVAARLGLELAFTNYPQRVLLRLPPREKNSEKKTPSEAAGNATADAHTEAGTCTEAEASLSLASSPYVTPHFPTSFPPCSP